MNRDDLVRFASRDWARVESGKLAYWPERKRSMTPADSLILGATLRQYARRLRPDWPSALERAQDQDTHCRVAEALRAVHVAAG